MLQIITIYASADHVTPVDTSVVSSLYAKLSCGHNSGINHPADF